MKKGNYRFFVGSLVLYKSKKGNNGTEKDSMADSSYSSFCSDIYLAYRSNLSGTAIYRACFKYYSVKEGLYYTIGVLFASFSTHLDRLIYDLVEKTHVRYV